jgi:hypothetical protein
MKLLDGTIKMYKREKVYSNIFQEERVVLACYDMDMSCLWYSIYCYVVRLA